MQKNRLCWLLVGIVVLLTAPGCVAAVAAGAGAATGYAAGKYQVSGEVRGSYETVWDTALSVLRSQGTGISIDDRRGILKATVEGSQVQVRIKKKNPTYTVIRIRAWKDMLPNEKLAIRLFKDLQDRL